MSPTQTTPDVETFHLITKAEPFRGFLEPLRQINDETRLIAREGELHSRIPDPANVAMADVYLDPSAFESFNPNGETVLGVKLERLEEVLRFADPDDLVEFRLDPETRLLEVNIGDGYEFERALIDPNTIKAMPDRPDLDFTTEVTLEGRAFSRAISAADMSSTHATLRGNPDGNSVVLESEGDLERNRIEFGEEDLLEVGQIGVGESIFSLEYLGEFENAVDSSAEVTLRFGDDLPMFLEYSFADGAGEAMFMLAPRLKNE